MRCSAFLVLIICLFSQTISFAQEISAPASDEALLRKIQQDSFQYFIAHSHPETGLTYDSSRADSPVSIAATGFALASYAVASANGWLAYREAYEKIEESLKKITTDRTQETPEHLKNISLS